MKAQVYQIRALTNLHPGSGDNSYGIVDKLIQRDPTTGYPTIHMSGIKGAMREFFENNGVDEKAITNLFGSAPQADSAKIQQGSLRFISAELLALPQPTTSPNGQAYQVSFVNEQIGAWLDKVAFFNPIGKVKLNDSDWVATAPEVFASLASEMPVIARNYLDDGQSKNLWYEEFVPREAVFGCVVQGAEADLETFNKQINGKVIQLGGNATVGYGYCLFTSISNA